MEHREENCVFRIGKDRTFKRDLFGLRRLFVRHQTLLYDGIEIEVLIFDVECAIFEHSVVQKVV